MNVRKALVAPFRALKALTMRWPRANWWGWLMPRTRFDYAREVDATASSIVVAVVNWMARTFPEAPIQIMEELPDGTRKKVPGHEMVRRIERPNAWYSGTLMWMATIADWAMSGNGYWLKVRARNGRPAELWWAPSWSLEPKWSEDGSTFISHYEYKVDPARDALKIDPADVVHFRYGLDPANTRKGLSPLRSVLREIFTDDEAANFTAALLRNLGVPGVVISPDGFQNTDTDSAEQIKTEFKEKFGGDRRGEPMVMTAPTKVQVLAFSPEQMLLKELRRIPEERVSAVYGVAAVVAGLGAGLDRSTFTNFAEAREAAYEGNIIPTQRLMAADLEVQLLPDFDTDKNHKVAFDLSQVRVLQPDMDKLYERVDRGVRGGWMTVARALVSVGQPARPEDEVYLRPMTIMAVPLGAPVEQQTLNVPKELKQANPLASFVQLLALTRARVAETHEAAVETFFKEQAARVMSRLAAFGLRSRNGNGRKQPVVGPRTLLPGDEDDALKEALSPLWLASLASAWDLAAEVFNLEARFDEQSAPVAVVLGDAFHRARRINDGTRAAIGSHFEEGERRGYTMQQVLDGVPEDDFKGLRDVAESYYAGRPATVAQTEAMWASNMGTTAAYRSNGVPRVQMVDGGDDPACAARNGLVVSLSAGEAATNSEHPHGTLTLVPAM